MEWPAGQRDGADVVSDTKNIPLLKPVTFEGKTYESLDLKEPTAGQMEKAEKLSEKYGFTVVLVAEVSGVPIGAVDLMGQRDTEAAEEYLSSFGMDDDHEQIEESPEEKTITLLKPIALGDLTFNELDLREPTNAERRKASQAGGSFSIAIAQIALLGNWPKVAVKMLCARDFMEAVKYFGGFSKRRPRTGSR
jgi:Phage tail assembly chaperone proteins, E, or 41 or 14